MVVGDRVILKNRPATGKGVLVRRMASMSSEWPDRYLMQFDDGAPKRWVTLDEVMPERVNVAV